MTTPPTPWLWLRTADGNFVRADQIVAVELGIPTNGKRTVTVVAGTTSHELLTEPAQHSGVPSHHAEHTLELLGDLMIEEKSGVVAWVDGRLDLVDDWTRP